MELVSPHVRRTLAYVCLLNDQGVDPSREDVEAFARDQSPRGAEYQSSMFPSMSWMFNMMREVKVRDAEPVVDYLLRMGWAGVPAGRDDNVHLTDLGRVLLRGLELDGSTEPTVADIVLAPTDPLAWVNLTRVVASAGAGMLVDAYFTAEFVPWLVESTTLRRVLISSRHPQAASDLAGMAVALATVPNAAALEVRATDSPELHDRCLVRADGTLQLLGSSVNGVGRNLPAVITPDAGVMRVYRERCENLWNNATVVAPQPPGGVASPGS